ncbi:phosphodiesterase [Caerostris darwini]|uniref:Phosphodiesterase n=1 Tax=Caerostris darwini TaxID=1538125 RepID=A0AAV4QN05_9ARAC|nr:phosphodiesterase [Caerostris darwini]
MVDTKIGILMIQGDLCWNENMSFIENVVRPNLNTTSDGIPTFLTLSVSGNSVPLFDSTSSYAVRKILKQLVTLSYERELIFELAKEIKDGLEQRSLSHKILQNISIFTNADRCSLCLVKGEKGDPNRYKKPPFIIPVLVVDMTLTCRRASLRTHAGDKYPP